MSAGEAGCSSGDRSAKGLPSPRENGPTTSGVHTGPGAIAFARIPRLMTSSAKPFVSVTIAPFGAA